jgi:signal transduction histidine kinase/ligand-binding sensor domain-containing protein
MKTGSSGPSRRWLFGALVLFVLGGGISGERLPVKIYTTEEGLAHDRVNKIVRDSRGFLWFCTSEGLSRFDGVKFKNYKQDQGLPHREVNDFLETSDGTFLVATNGGLAVFDPNGRAYSWNILASKLEQTGEDPPLFRTYLPNTGDSFDDSILSLAEDLRGRIWAGTANGFFEVRKNSAGIRQFEEFRLEPKNIDGLSVASLVPDRSGGLFVGTNVAVYHIPPAGDPVKLLGHGSESFLIDRDGRLWMDSGVTGDGLKIFAFLDGKLELLETYKEKDGLPDDSFYFALHQTSDGRIFVGMHDGLLEFLPEAGSGEAKFRVLSADKVTTLTEDAGGNLWVGTELKGAWKLARRGFTIFGEPDGFGEKDDIRSIHFDRAGNLFLAVRPQKILRYRNGKFESIKPLNLPKRSWSWHFLDVHSMDDEWWIPSSNGLLRYPPVADVSELAGTRPKKIYTTDDGLPGNEIFNIFEDSKGDIWFTIVGAENSLMRWERKSEKFHNYTTADGLPRYNGPIAFAEDRHGSIWFGHYFEGLTRFRNGKFDHYTVKDGLPKTLISDLLIDSAGRLWIGTSVYGLFRIDETNAEKPVFENISTAEGLSSNQIICLTEDRFKQIYAGTGRGINRFKTDGKIGLFTRADGLPSNYITRCAADKDGFLWFVSQNTLVRFRPEVGAPDSPPPVYIDKVSVGGVPQKISTLGETSIDLPDLTSDQSQVEIDFFALTFGAEENILYQYRFDGQDWSTPTGQQTINLNLSPGRHEFAVRAVRADGLASERPAVVTFNILPPVWLRWWFITLCILALVLFVFLFYRYRISNLRTINAALQEAKSAEEDLRKSREERLAELEQVRSRIATDLHDDIGASLTQIAILSEVARTQNQNGVSEPLEAITGVSNELVGTMSDIVWSINPAKDHFSDLTQRMRRLASDMLSPKGIGLDFSSPDADSEITVNSNIRREVFLIFKESINNIVKHSGAGRVKIGLGISGPDLRLKIVDDGNGFAFGEASDGDGVGGNGIPNMKKRAAEMNGELLIETAEGAGTTIDLRLPMETAARTGGDVAAHL